MISNLQDLACIIIHGVPDNFLLSYLRNEISNEHFRDKRRNTNTSDMRLFILSIIITGKYVLIATILHFIHRFSRKKKERKKKIDINSLRVYIPEARQNQLSRIYIYIFFFYSIMLISFSFRLPEIKY